MDEDITDHSEIVNWALCEIIGDNDVVKLRRILSTLGARLVNPTKSLLERIYLQISKKYFGGLEVPSMPESIFEQLNILSVDSGSRAEGFDFPSSDYDNMFVVKDIKVIQRASHENLSQSNMILSVEKKYTRPGFVRLKAVQIPKLNLWATMLWPTAFTLFYLSSTKWLDHFRSANHINGSDFNPHGPCLNSIIGRDEFDIAYTLSSEHWPMEAIGCLKRLLNRGWPSYDVIKGMVSDGCLFVPIGCKSSICADIEWRMSFSLAETRLAHSMNHTQFITYGLLKLFLKEVIEKNDATKNLLCSYFMKTLVFWEIIETNNSWSPSFLLQNAWNCFRRLLCWIKNEYCPNFFIPENNMFFGKIHGHTRQTLLTFLNRNYKRGYNIFFEIPSIRNEIDRLGLQQGLTISNVLNRSLVIYYLYSGNVIRSYAAKVYSLLQYSDSSYLVEFKELLKLYELSLTCFKKLCGEISEVEFQHNRIKYLKEKALINIIKRSSPDCIQGRIFLALYFYRCKRYESCVTLLRKAIQKLEGERIIYMSEFNPDIYFSLGGEDMSISDGICKFVACDVPLDSDICIPEILDECKTPLYNINHQFISPWVLSNFVLFLCHFWKGDTTQARVHIEDIRNCLQNRHHISGSTYIFSWHILGRGQEIFGDFPDALQSYTEFIKGASNYGMTTPFVDFLDLNEKRIKRLMSLIS